MFLNTLLHNHTLKIIHLIVLQCQPFDVTALRTFFLYQVALFFSILYVFLNKKKTDKESKKKNFGPVCNRV